MWNQFLESKEYKNKDLSLHVGAELLQIEDALRRQENWTNVNFDLPNGHKCVSWWGLEVTRHPNMNTIGIALFKASPKLLVWHLTFDGKCSRTNKVPAQLPVCCFLTEHNVTVSAGWMRLCVWSGHHPPWCLPALLLPLGCFVCRAEGRHSAVCPVDSGISHVYLAELGWKFIILPRSFDFREVVFVFAASLVCVPHF